MRRNDTVLPYARLEDGVHKHKRFGRMWAIMGVAVLVGGVIAIVTPSKDAKHSFVAATIIVALVAFFFGMAVLYHLKARKRERRLGESNGRPWLLREDWASGVVLAKTPPGLIAAWPASAILLAVSAVMILVEVRDELIRQLVRPLGYFNGAMAIVCLVWGIVLVLRRATHGRPALTIPELPLVPGRQYDMSVRTRARFTGLGSAQARLTCTLMAGVGRQHATVKKIHDEEFKVDLSSVGVESDRTVVPVHVPIPSDLPDRQDDYDPVVTWSLAFTCDAFPRVLQAEFALPVYRDRTEASSDGSTAGSRSADLERRWLSKERESRARLVISLLFAVGSLCFGAWCFRTVFGHMLRLHRLAQSGRVVQGKVEKKEAGSLTRYVIAYTFMREGRYGRPPTDDLAGFAQSLSGSLPPQEDSAESAGERLRKLREMEAFMQDLRRFTDEHYEEYFEELKSGGARGLWTVPVKGAGIVTSGFYDSVEVGQAVDVTVIEGEGRDHTMGRVDAARVWCSLWLFVDSTFFGLLFTGMGISIPVSLLVSHLRRRRLSSAERLAGDTPGLP